MEGLCAVTRWHQLAGDLWGTCMTMAKAVSMGAGSRARGVPQEWCTRGNRCLGEAPNIL